MKNLMPIDESLFFRLVRVVNLTARPFNQEIARQHRISLNEWRAMVVLASHPGVAASDIAYYTGLDKMSVSRAVAELDRHSRLTKRLDSRDKRRTRLWLNPEGRKLFNKIAKAGRAREEQLFQGISETEKKSLARIVDKLIVELQAEDSSNS